MYSKYSKLYEASRAFQEVPERDAISWRVIICGNAKRGLVMEALNLYNEMLQLGPPGIRPNEVTFVGVLSACSHNGLLKEAYTSEKWLTSIDRITPKAEHCTCVVDLLRRKGLLQEAEALILALPMTPDNVMWVSLLGACKLHGDVKMAKYIVERLCASEPHNSSNYILLADSYTDVGDWGEAVKVREVMEARGIEKTTGRSSVDIGTYMHSLLVGDYYSHPRIEVASEVLLRLYLQMRDTYAHDEVSSSLH